MNLTGYVVYKRRRYSVVRPSPGYDAQGIHRVDAFLVLKPFTGPLLLVLASECKPWKRGTVRHVKGTLIHRDKRPVRLDIDTGARRSQTCRFYDWS